MTAAPAPDAVSPLVAAAFAALDAGGVSWCVLREERALRRRPHDVDLLVDPRDAARVDGLLAPLGFARVPIRGRHRFLAAWDAAERRWLRLDVVTELAFGRGEPLRLDARTLLERRGRNGGVPVAASGDRFWISLAHELLDRGALEAGRREVLRGLAVAAADDSPLAAPLARRLGRDAAALRELALEARWDELAATAPPEARRRPRRLRRAAGRLHVVASRRGVSVAILGPDGSGKSTLAAGLVGSFPLPARIIYMGLQRGSSVPGKTWDAAAAGPRRRRPAYRRLARQLRRLARYALHAGEARLHLAAGRLVVFDRYTYDAAVHWENVRGPGGRLRLWLVQHVAPRPDVVIVLDVPARTMFERKGEHDVALLDRRRRRYLDVAATLAGAVVLDGAAPPDEVLAAATEAVWRRYAAR